MIISTVPIRKSVFKYLTDNTAVAGKVSHPEELDIEASGLVSWYELEIVEIAGVPSRNSCMEANVELNLEVYSRHTTNIHAADTIADSLATLLGRTVLNIYDYDDSDNPRIGWLKLFEPSVQHNTVGENQHVNVVINGIYYQV